MSESFSIGGTDMSQYGMTVLSASGYDPLATPRVNDVQIPGGGTGIYIGTWGETLIRLSGVCNLYEVTAVGITTLVQLIQAIAEKLDSFEYRTLTLDAYPGQTWEAMLDENAVQCEYLHDHAFTWTCQYIVEPAA
jgi:hypothetical protein